MTTNLKKNHGIVNKKGSIFIEASMILPITVLTIAGLICLIMFFHGQFAKQADEHIRKLSEEDYSAQMEMIRNNENYF